MGAGRPSLPVPLPRGEGGEIGAIRALALALGRGPSNERLPLRAGGGAGGRSP